AALPAAGNNATAGADQTVQNVPQPAFAGAATGSQGALPPSAAVQFTYKLPAGWKELSASEFRNVNLSFGPAGAGERYVSLLSDAGGGILENVNRWRKQMGAPELTQADLADLPTLSLLGQQAVYLELSGDYAGMMGSGAIKRALLLGVLGKDAAG